MQAEKRWPNLYQFLGGYVHQNWDDFYSSPEEAIDHAISEFTSEMLSAVILEWSAWKQGIAKKTDPRKSLNDGFGVNVFFRFPNDARKFMKMIDEKLDVATTPPNQRDGISK
ncbi:MAG: hypothetical protein Pars92KO_12370 [Parasphingorhabdus sp.]